MSQRILAPRPPLRSGEGEVGPKRRERVVQNPWVDPLKASLARQLRKHGTPAEVEVWNLLRNRRMLGLKFRRQQVFQGFVLDFYFSELSLAIELDGSVHETQQEWDRARDETLRLSGLKILRLGNEEASQARLEAEITSLLSPPAPPLRNGEGAGG